MGRRKLADIALGKDVKLTFHELQALDTFLTQRGKGLSTLLDRPSLLKSLAWAGKTTFLLGAKPQPEQRTIVMSEWDVRSMADLLRVLDQFTVNLHFDIEEVLLRQREADMPTSPANFDGDPWFNLIHAANAPSLVCLERVRHF